MIKFYTLLMLRREKLKSIEYYHDFMKLTKKELEIVMVLVKKELEAIQKENKQILISNSPFFGEIGLDKDNLDFIKNEKTYEEFLKKLLKTLKR